MLQRFMQCWPHNVIALRRTPGWRGLFDGVCRGVEELSLATTVFVALLALGVFVVHLPDPRPLVDNAVTAAKPHIPSMEALHAVHAVDGNTIQNGDTGERIRLANIEAAETGPRAGCPAEVRHGLAAKHFIRTAIAAGHEISIIRTGQVDELGRTVAYVRIDGADLGDAVRRAGLARVRRGHRDPWCGHRGQLLS